MFYNCIIKRYENYEEFDACYIECFKIIKCLFNDRFFAQNLDTMLM